LHTTTLLRKIQQVSKREKIEASKSRDNWTLPPPMLVHGRIRTSAEKDRHAAWLDAELLAQLGWVGVERASEQTARQPKQKRTKRPNAASQSDDEGKPHKTEKTHFYVDESAFGLF
jgi:hypothetical protein